MNYELMLFNQNSAELPVNNLRFYTAGDTASTLYELPANTRLSQ